MKKFVRTIHLTGKEDASRMKDNLNAAGFYAISGAGGQTIEVYVIEDEEYVEDKVMKITQQIIDKNRGRLAYTQWAFIMRKIFLIGLIAVLASGCTQWKRLTGQDDKNDPENIAGVWSAFFDLNGQKEYANFILTQDGGTIPGALFYLENYVPQGHVSGSVSGHSFTLTIDEGTACTNKLTASGEVNNGIMLVHLTGAGNNIPGTVCYPSPLDITFTLHR